MLYKDYSLDRCTVSNTTIERTPTVLIIKTVGAINYMPHKIPSSRIDHLTRGPSASKTTQVATLQNYIQELLGDTHHTFLQGSYVNDTAISDINDVDIVAVRKTTYSSIHSPHRFTESIPWDSIFSEIETQLKGQSKYAWTVTRGDKCIKVRGAFDVDVIPAVKVDHDHTTDPIVIYSHSKAVERPNFPRTFYENGVAKNTSTSGFYKPTVRMFKNWARNHINDDKTISSFKMQALVYGAQDSEFSGDYPSNFITVGVNMLEMLKPNGLVPKPIMSVCGTEDINVGWDPTLRAVFVNRLRESLVHASAAYKALDPNTAEASWKLAHNL